MQKYLCLYEKVDKRYKERDQKENAWRAVKQFLIVFLWTIRDQAILWKAIRFSSLLSLKRYTNNLKYDFLSLTYISCNKLWWTFCSILFFFKHFLHPHPFPFFFQVSKSTSSSDKSILRVFYNFSSCTFYAAEMLISLMSTWEIKEQLFPKKLFSLNNFLISVQIN